MVILKPTTRAGLYKKMLQRVLARRQGDERFSSPGSFAHALGFWELWNREWTREIRGQDFAYRWIPV